MSPMIYRLTEADERAARMLHHEGGGSLATWEMALALRAMVGSSLVPMRYRKGGDVSVGCLVPVTAYQTEGGEAFRIAIPDPELIPVAMVRSLDELTTGSQGHWEAWGWAPEWELKDRVRRTGGPGARFARDELLDLAAATPLGEVKPWSADPAPRAAALQEATAAALRLRAAQEDA